MDFTEIIKAMETMTDAQIASLYSKICGWYHENKRK